MRLTLNKASIWGTDYKDAKSSTFKVRFRTTWIYILDAIVLGVVTYFMYKHNIGASWYLFMILALSLVVFLITSIFANTTKVNAYKLYKRYGDRQIKVKEYSARFADLKELVHDEIAQPIPTKHENTIDVYLDAINANMKSDIGMCIDIEKYLDSIQSSTVLFDDDLESDIPMEKFYLYYVDRFSTGKVHKHRNKVCFLVSTKGNLFENKSEEG